MTDPKVDPIQAFEANIKDVKRLMELHREKAGDSPGRKQYCSARELLQALGLDFCLASDLAFVHGPRY
jgi:hypothetical protein